MHHRDKKKMKDKDEKYATRTITNSNSFQENTNINNSNRPQSKRSGPSQPHQHQQQAVTVSNNNNLNGNNQIKVSHQALKSAAENHLQPLKLRCGKDRKNEEDHKTCQIKCHNCQGDHTSTDYKCPTIQEYTGNLVMELRKRPDILPVNAQIFIPSECRQNGEKNKIIENKLAHQQQQQQKDQQFK
ncbi:unnamed protein product [Rotaria socialis]|nr:unnamed protein product [Rotaria socialis]